MLFPALGMTTAIWLLTAPLLGLETGFRAGLCVAAGVSALALVALAWWYPRAGGWLAGLGILLGFANFGLFAPIPALASLATSAVALIAAGLAPLPATFVTPAAAPAIPAAARAQPSARPTELPIAA